MSAHEIVDWSFAVMMAAMASCAMLLLIGGGLFIIGEIVRWLRRSR